MRDPMLAVSVSYFMFGKNRTNTDPTRKACAQGQRHKGSVMRMPPGKQCIYACINLGRSWDSWILLPRMSRSWNVDPLCPMFFFFFDVWRKILQLLFSYPRLPISWIAYRMFAAQFESRLMRSRQTLNVDSRSVLLGVQFTQQLFW